MPFALLPGYQWVLRRGCPTRTTSVGGTKVRGSLKWPWLENCRGWVHTGEAVWAGKASSVNACCGLSGLGVSTIDPPRRIPSSLRMVTCLHPVFLEVILCMQSLWIPPAFLTMTCWRATLITLGTMSLPDNPHGNPETSVSIFPLHGWRNWGSESVEAPWVWKNVSGAVTVFKEALLFDTTLSYHIPAFPGSMVPIWFIERENFSEIFLGCIPWV